MTNVLAYLKLISGDSPEKIGVALITDASVDEALVHEDHGMILKPLLPKILPERIPNATASAIITMYTGLPDPGGT